MKHRVRRAVATVIGATLLGLSGWYSWVHFHDGTAPIAVLVGAGMFLPWHERFRLRAVLFGGLALLAAFISHTGVVSRVGHRGRRKVAVPPIREPPSYPSPGSPGRGQGGA